MLSYIIKTILEEAKEDGVMYTLMQCEEGASIDDDVLVGLRELLTRGGSWIIRLRKWGFRISHHYCL
jgi:hypothetical protein